MYNAMVQSTRRTSKTDTRKQVGSIQVRGELLHVGWYRGFWIDDMWFVVRRQVTDQCLFHRSYDLTESDSQMVLLYRDGEFSRLKVPWYQAQCFHTFKGGSWGESGTCPSPLCLYWKVFQHAKSDILVHLNHSKYKQGLDATVGAS